MNNVSILRELIDKPLQPSPAEWAMSSEDILRDLNMLSGDASRHISNIKFHNGRFSQDNDALIFILKKALKSVACVVKPPVESVENRIFIAMRFDDERERLYREVLEPMAHNFGYSIVKVNDQEYEGSIIGKIIDDILSSNILLADLTTNRGGIYYEAGIAKGLQLCSHPIRIILTCEKSFFDKESVHFDVSGDNIVLYESDDDYRMKLTKRLSAIISERKDSKS